jgi:hypothetical protein
MGGKFRVKATPDWTRRQFCAGTAVESTSRGVFIIPRSVPIGAKLFSLGRSAVITDNEP